MILRIELGSEVEKEPRYHEIRKSEPRHEYEVGESKPRHQDENFHRSEIDTKKYLRENEIGLRLLLENEMNLFLKASHSLF